MNTTPCLTYGIVNGFGNRKQQGRLSLFVDTTNGNVYPVPRGVEHIDYARKILRDDPADYNHLVPVDLDMEGMPETITGIRTGVCGLEISLGVRHDMNQLIIAKRRALEWVRRGKVPLNVSTDELVTKYCITNHSPQKRDV